MRILFGATPAVGHVLPLLPLADAAVEAGHEVAFLTAAPMAAYLGGRRLLAAGPAFDQVIAVNLGRVGAARDLGPAAAELLAGTRVDLSWDDALRQGLSHRPGLLVGESLDFVTPLLAARLGVPWAAYSICGPPPVEFLDAIEQRTGAQHARHSVEPLDRLALLDPYPDSLRLPTDAAPKPDRIPVRAGGIALAGTGLPSHPVPPRPAGLPRALITMGTSVGNPELVAELARSVAEAGIDVLVTARPDQLRPGPRVHAVGFRPLPELLAAVEVVIGAAGLGTLLATLGAGVPRVLLPVLGDQPFNAARAVHRGVASRIDDPAEAGTAVRQVLEDPRFREAAREVAAEIAAMNSPDRALAELLALCR